MPRTKNHTSNIKTRFAPSPTGVLHIGAARTALFNFVFGKQLGGEMIVRIEDTDKKRSEKKYEVDILENLEWLGITYEAIFWQSKREDRYEEYLRDLIKNDRAYKAEDNVIRFRNPNKVAGFNDLIRGEIKADTSDLGDFVIARNEKEPLYHLACVIDDHELGITHIIRGEDHISNTPRQILLQESIGAKRPLYAHIPLILSPDKSKLSKRRGAKSVGEYRRDGYLKDAVVNFIALIGWSPQAGGEILPEVFDMHGLIKNFSLGGIQKSAAALNEDKLNWINKEHLKQLPKKDLEKAFTEYLPHNIKSLPQFSQERFLKMIPMFLERIEKFSDIQKMCDEGDIQYFFEKPRYSIEKVIWKNEKTNAEKTSEYLQKLVQLLSHVEETNFTEGTVKETLWEYATKEGRGAVLWPMRYALSGKERSPDPFTIASVLGKEEAITRLKNASLELTRL